MRMPPHPAPDGGLCGRHGRRPTGRRGDWSGTGGSYRGLRPPHCELRTTGSEWTATDEALGIESRNEETGWVGLGKR